MYSIFISAKTLRLFVVITALFVMSNILAFYLAADDLSRQILYNENNLVIVKNSEFKYRETILKRFDEVKIDSILSSVRLLWSHRDASESFRDFYISKFCEYVNDTSFYVKNNLPWTADFAIFSYDSVQIKLRVDKSSLLSMLKTAKTSDQIDYVFKYGNYSKQEILAQNKFKIGAFLIIISAAYLISVLGRLLKLFLEYIINKKKISNYKLQDKSLIEDLILKLEQYSADANNNSNQPTEILVDVQLLNQLIKSSKENQQGGPGRDILIKDLRGFNNRSKEMYERASLFLVFTFLISIFGVIIFYSLLPEYRTNMKIPEYFGMSIRPFVILIFFQSLAFYLLRQYKSSIEDYKFFYLEQKNRKRFLIAHEMLENSTNVNLSQIIGLEILKERDTVPQLNLGLEEKGRDDNASVNTLYEQLYKLLSVKSEK